MTACWLLISAARPSSRMWCMSPMEPTSFAHITTESGRDVKMTKNYILPAGTCGSTLPLVYAVQVSVDDCVMNIDGLEKVTSVKVVRGEGVYTIVTNEEYLVVHGVISSPFGGNHMMANLFYHIHRFVYALSPLLLTSTLLQRRVGSDDPLI